MGSKEMKKAVLQEKLELLRTVTKSHAVNKASIIVDATKYIEELKQKVEESEQQLDEEDSKLPKVTVTSQEKGFLINVFSQQSCPRLLVSVFEAFDDIGLEVLDANVSCADSFQLEAIGGESQESVDAQTVRQVVLQAIKKCMETSQD
ncbi:transcription factor SCREAM2-like isoform X2 [Carex littledalei]|uniref:Transcription factor SCREAM2-like isoform X2 n=1 Tax=Carex littledalei TaxID=544730 RepID=A0A833QRE6_9POAL|nr:transcription factor SCREAM2-like isoform X2 [Carex littledalei]